MTDALTTTMGTMPAELLRSLTWNRGIGASSGPPAQSATATLSTTSAWASMWDNGSGTTHPTNCVRSDEHARGAH